MFLCMQTINFTPHFFLKILKRYSKHVTVSTLGMYFVYNFQETLMFIFNQTINFIFNYFLKIFQRYCKLVILGTLDMIGHTHQKLKYQLKRNSAVYLNENNKIHPSLFS